MNEAIHRTRARHEEVLVLVFLADPAVGLYEQVKHVGDILAGVPTQCIVSGP